MNRALKVVLSCLCGLILSCNTNEAQETAMLFWVGNQRVPCEGVFTQQCYLVQEGTNSLSENWIYLYEGIDGFDTIYEEGFIYKISVLQKKVQNPAQDQSAFEYKLIEVVYKKLSEN